MLGGDQLVSKSLPPIQMLLWCPACGARHVDRGEFATKRHHTHACQDCGMCWRPAIEPTCGVQYLPGFKDAPVAQEAVEQVSLEMELRGHLDAARGCLAFADVMGDPQLRAAVEQLIDAMTVVQESMESKS